MAMGPFAKAIKDRKTDLDWLSYNEENVNNYIKDPLCGVEFTLGSYWTLLSLIKKMNKGKLYKNSNKELPFLLISGMEDPCTGGEVGRNNSLSILYQGGFHKIDMITLEHMRHEILNEIDKERVYQDILKFYEK